MKNHNNVDWDFFIFLECLTYQTKTKMNEGELEETLATN